MENIEQEIDARLKHCQDELERFVYAEGDPVVGLYLKRAAGYLDVAGEWYKMAARKE